jgi:hypothetical protein
MTQLDVMYRYAAPPSETTAMALGRVREVYGIRQLHVDEPARTIRVEYDATRLTEPIVHQLLRRTGLDVVERLSLIPPQPEPAPAPVTA